MLSTEFIAFDSYAPLRAVTNDDLSKLVDTSDEWISSRTGISERRISEGENTSDMCTKVAKGLIEKSGIAPEDIGLIIVATITPDYATPNTASLVQSAIGAVNAFAFDISAACSGFVFATSIADKYIKAGMCKYAIVIGAETLSKIVNWEDRATCVLFGDGAGGAIMAQSERNCYLAEDMHSDGSLGLQLTGGETKVRNAYSSPEEPDRRYLEMDGRTIFNFATRKVPKSVQLLLEKAGLTTEDIDWVVPHQANSRIVEVVAKKLGMPMDKFYMNIAEYGNTSAASIPLALAQMSREGLLKKGQKIVLTGFGGGLTWGSAIIEI
jgi:3-oxoacyl-[acyl-carrier-protein] synthase-3